MRTLAVLILAIATTSACQMNKASRQDPTPHPETIEVTASLAGYELWRELPTGEHAPLFTGDKATGSGAGAFLFFVLSPTNYAGQYFRLHHDGYLASGDPARLYRPDTRYRFNIVKSKLVDLGDAGCSLRPLGKEVHPQQSELEVLIKSLTKECNRLARVIDKLQATLDKQSKLTPVNESQIRILEERLKDYRTALENNAKRKKTACDLLNGITSKQANPPSPRTYPDRP